MKKYLNSDEIIELNIPDFPTTRQAISYRAKKEGWKWHYDKEHQGRGRPKRLYEVPLHYQVASISKNENDKVSKSTYSGLNEVAATQGIANAAILADWQRDCAIARLAVVRHVLQLAELTGKTRAVEGFEKASKEGRLDATWVATVKRANSKSGAKSGGKEGKATVSRRTLFNWIKEFEVAGSSDNASAVALLAPKAREVTMPEWAGILLKIWGDPAKPELAEVMRRIERAFANSDATLPSYHQARYFLQTHVGSVERERGRMGSREIKNIKPFVRRDTSVLLPADVYTADGHTFDAEIMHPITSRPFRVEVTTVLDVCTRMVVGYSIDLAESGLAVLDAVASSACDYGVPAIFYVDNGSGYKNAMMTADATGLMTRLGTEMRHSIAYNSQARGMIERVHKTIWIRLARRLPTYIGVDMDRQARQAMYKKTRKEIKEMGVSNALVSWDDFLVLAEEAVTDYNNEPHGGLPRRHNKTTGRREHLTPQKMWDEQVALMAEAGHALVTVSAAERDDLYRPYLSRKCLRGEINIFGNKYFSTDLTQYHDETVLVGYDIHDGSRIWVRDGTHRLIAIAEFEGNKKGYFNQSALGDAREKRAVGQVKRAQVHVDTALENLAPHRVLEHVQGQMMPTADIERAQAMLSERLAMEDAVVVEVQSDATLTSPPTQQPIQKSQPMEKPVTKPAEAVSQDARFERWMGIEAQVKAGAVLDASEQDFYELYPESKIFKIKMKAYSDQHEADYGTRPFFKLG